MTVFALSGLPKFSEKARCARHSAKQDAPTHTHIWRDNQSCDLSPNLLGDTIWRPSSGHHKASEMLLTAAQKSSWQPQDPPPSQCVWSTLGSSRIGRATRHACAVSGAALHHGCQRAGGMVTSKSHQPLCFKGALRTHLASLPPQEQNRTDGGEHVAAFSGSLKRGHGTFYLPMA